LPDEFPDVEVLDLDLEADREGLTVAHITALSDARVRRADAALRRWMARRVMWAFILGNAVTLCAFGALVWLDQSDIEAKVVAPGDRLITSQVFMALLGATTVQVGTIAVLMTRYLFPARQP
jgi:hypothetical protein